MVNEAKMVIILLFVLRRWGHLICINIIETLTALEQKRRVYCNYLIITIHALKKLMFYGRTTPTATGVLRSWLRAYYTYGYRRAYDAYGYGRTTLTATGVLGLRLRGYYAYGYGRIVATTMGVLQAYYGSQAGCKLTSGHYSCNHES